MARGPRADVNSAQRTISILRDTHAAINRTEDIYDELDADFNLIEELTRCSEAVAGFPPDDPRHIAAVSRIDFLASPGYRTRMKVRGVYKRAVRRMGQEMLVSALVALQTLLIVVCNIVGFFLFVFLALWLLSG